jgi:hypothetical protein
MDKSAPNTWIVALLIVLAVGASTFAAENRWREQQRDAQQESVVRAVGTLRARLEGLLGQ